MLRRIFPGIAAALIAAASLSTPIAAQAKPAGVAGSWTLDVPESPHGPMTLALVLEQKGKDVTGTLTIPQAGDIRLRGEFADGKLSLVSDGGDHALKLTATLKQPVLTGYVSSERGDMKWTAKRTASGR